jgi:hypothetical protein
VAPKTKEKRTKPQNQRQKQKKTKPKEKNFFFVLELSKLKVQPWPFGLHLFQMSTFDVLVSKETVGSFGIDMSLWGDHEQKLLTEGMILAWKENPDWTEEEAKKECEEQVHQILLDWFKKNLGYLVKKTNYWVSLEYAYQDFSKTTLKEFVSSLQDKQEFQDFVELFYDDLRELYNIDSVGVEEEFKRMKDKGWTFSQYRSWLTKQFKR